MSVASVNAFTAVRNRAAPKIVLASITRLSADDASLPIIAVQPAAVSPMPNTRTGPIALERIGPLVGPMTCAATGHCTVPS